MFLETWLAGCERHICYFGEIGAFWLAVWNWCVECFVKNLSLNLSNFYVALSVKNLPYSKWIMHRGSLLRLHFHGSAAVPLDLHDGFTQPTLHNLTGTVNPISSLLLWCLCFVPIGGT